MAISTFMSIVLCLFHFSTAGIEVGELPHTGEADSISILLVSSTVRDGDLLAEAARERVVIIRYEAQETSLANLAGLVREALGGRQAASVGLVTHDHGVGRFYLAGSHSICLATTLTDKEEKTFWRELGEMIAPGGRIDVFACDLAATDEGEMLVSALADAAGVDVAASTNPTGNPSAGGDWLLESGGIDLTAAYFGGSVPAGFSGLLDAYEQKLTASDPAVNAEFGFSVAFSGDYAAIGALDDNDRGTLSGSVYIFHRSGGTWSQLTKLTASDAAVEDHFGYHVSISGDYLIVGAPFNDDAGDSSGSAYIFNRNQGGTDNWGQVKKLTAGDAAAGDFFGGEVSICGNYAIVGASVDDNCGSAYIFNKDEGGTDNWGQVKKLTASDPGNGDHFGGSVSISGEYVVIGASGNDDAGNASGSAYIFYRYEGGVNNWGQQKKLTAGDAQSNDFFGCSVSISGDHAIVGAYGDYDLGPMYGSAYIFAKDYGGANNWGEVKEIMAGDPENQDVFGMAVSISGDYAVVGAHYHGTTGAAYVFYKDQGSADNWGQVIKLTASDGATGDDFGNAVFIDGDYVLIGADDDCDGGDGTGSVYSYRASPYAGNLSATAITTSSATLNASVYNSWQVVPSSSGIVWGAGANPTVGSCLGNEANTGGEGSFSVSATGLEHNKTYHYRAYVTSSQGTTYSQDATFRTRALVGSLGVTITPNKANDAGAAWRIEPGDGTWHASGYTIRGLATGNYTVVFKETNGWKTPDSRSVFVPVNGLATAEGNYVEKDSSGDLTINFTSASAVSSGARWRVRGPADASTPPVNLTRWRKSGESIAIDAGKYVIEFLPVPGWLHFETTARIRTGKDTVVSAEGVPFLVSGCTDFDGDGTADIACFNPAKNTWTVKDGLESKFGRKGSWPVAGDYDGDGCADLAYWLPKRGLWRIKDLTNVKGFGIEGDLPVPGDYDGDGICDPALYRPSTGEWMMVLSGAAEAPGKTDVKIVALGGDTYDIPAPADYDGDGSVDAAVYNLKTQLWTIDGQDGDKFGRKGWLPVPADYNGDGIADLAVANLDSGIWWIDGASRINLNSAADDFPLLHDLDGDGVPDPGYYRFVEGCWYIVGSDGKETAIEFGSEKDLPLSR